MAAAAYKTEHVAVTPKGWRVRTVTRGSHQVRVAFPPGARKKGSGKVVEILHPKSEQNPSCIVSHKAKSNPAELLIFGNPEKKNSTKLEQQRAARERAERIRSARRHPTRNPKAQLTSEENRAWERAFEHYINEGKTDSQADRLAWRDLKKQFPRLKKFSGAKPNPKRSTPCKRRTDRRMRSNPSEEKEAVKLFESFHGKEPKEIVEKQVSAAMRLDYAALGDLIKLIVITPLGQRVEFDFEGDGVKLASSPDGKTLYCIGGNQNLAKCLDAKSLEKDLVDLGECVQVEYLARKIHANYQPVVYYHKMGEKTGDRPTLMYDKLKRQIFFVGGAYYIDKDKGVSPGIEN